jgi:hypothetical protein
MLDVPLATQGRFEALHATSLTAPVGREEELELLLRRWSKAKTRCSSSAPISRDLPIPGSPESNTTWSSRTRIGPIPRQGDSAGRGNIVLCTMFKCLAKRTAAMTEPTDNIGRLHAHEEQLRVESLALIAKRDGLSDHWQLVQEAMNVIYAFSHDHEHGSDDELTMQFLGIRLFNAAAASVKLALSGYYQKAFVHLRDILETYFLVDCLRSNPEQIAVWKNADNRTLKRDFSPMRIREALDKRDGYATQGRKKFYDLVSQYASHATYRGFQLTAQRGFGQIGPFIDESKLQAWLEEMAKRFGHAAVCLLSDFEGQDTSSTSPEGSISML